MGVELVLNHRKRELGRVATEYERAACARGEGVFGKLRAPFPFLSRVSLGRLMHFSKQKCPSHAGRFTCS